MKAFELPKATLAEAPVLACPIFEEGCEFIVTTDASATEGGAVLSQVQDDKEKAIALQECHSMKRRKNIALLIKNWQLLDLLHKISRHICMVDTL